ALGLHEGGSGWNARITLDSNAAGHGWYVDATPWSPSSPFNDDYLPTSDPNLWLAKPGSGAEGKMDLLTVWLHELGHAAGMEHTESGTGLMGTTLLPGQRRRVQVADQRRADGGWLWRLEFCANRHFVCNWLCCTTQKRNELTPTPDAAMPWRPRAPLSGARAA
ncbi:MAG: matrixin family metalloprotease, partial [Hydrogenophaga sp.]|nr:matrixin family metalloprotease [Hydrogenophaga sp.]